MTERVTFLNDNAKKNIEKQGRESLASRRDDFEEFMKAFEEGDEELMDEFYSYGLSFDNKLEEHGYYSYCLSTGGPHSEIRFHGKSGMIEFVHLDWFSGVGFDVSDDKVFQWVRDMVIVE